MTVFGRPRNFLIAYRRLLIAGVVGLMCLEPQAVPQPKNKIVHVFVALADNAHQGIVPVPAELGDGDDADRNLYWGAAFGVRTFFTKSKDWIRLGQPYAVDHHVLQRVAFRHSSSGTYLVADAYRGGEIKQAVEDFLAAAAGLQPAIEFDGTAGGKPVHIEAKADLVVYVGHDGLMDFSLQHSFQGGKEGGRQAIILACASKAYFADELRRAGAEPLLWTTGLMAPEAYTLKAALDGWIAGESKEQIRRRAAAAYAQYQKTSQKAVLRLFASDW